MEIYEFDELDELKEDDYLITRNILLKNYQIKLLEEAKKQNTIIYLPTGAGKTLIAIHVLFSRTKDVMKPISEGGKIAFFLSNTKVMTYQLKKVLQTHTKFKVCYFNGDMNVDSWNREKWVAHFERNQVIVLTGEILRHILVLKYLDPSDITLIVFDECHHAVADHPYNLVLQCLAESISSEKPLLLGLSSVLLNSNPKNEQVSPIIQSLESAFGGKVKTETELEEIMTLATNPTEKIVAYKMLDSSFTETYLKLYDNAIVTLKELFITSKEFPVPEGAKSFKANNKLTDIKKGFVKSKAHFEEFGVFGASLSALFFIMMFEKHRLMSNDEKEIQVLIYARTELNKIRHILLKVMGNEENSSSIIEFLSPKVRKLIELIKEVNEYGERKNVLTIIFVHQRDNAVVLAFLLKRLSEVDEKFSFVKADFVVGSSALSKKSTFLEFKTEEVLKRFSSQSLNVLVATNVLEEGVDISACNVVVSFDFPQTYPSYFQSKGRARNKKSLYYVFMEESEVSTKSMILESYKKIGDTLMKEICSDFEVIEEEDEEKSTEVEKLYINGKSGEIVIDGLTAIKAVYRYCTKLPQDRFSLLSPFTWYIVNDNKKKAFIQLPVSCPMRNVIQGEWCQNKKLAKRSAFLIAVKKLYEIGELDDDFDYRSFNVKEEDFKDLFPHYKKENIDPSMPQPGMRKRKQVYKMKFAESLSNCLPTPGVKVYLHVIELTIAFDKPELDRKIAIYDVLRLPVTFAILSTKKLYKIFQFPVFLDMGQINCDFLINYDEIILSESEISDIKLCHFALFQKVTRVFKNSQIFDSRNKEHSFFIVPVEKNEEDRYVLNWDLIRLDFCKNNNSALVRYNPTSQPGQKRNFDTFQSDITISGNETSNSLVPGKLSWSFIRDENIKKPKFEYTEAAYKYFVITPNYRNIDPPQCYIVSKLCYEMSPLSPFPRENYTDYLHYYKDKYFIEITNTKQPLLKVSPLYGCSNFNKPKFRKPRRAREKYKEYEEHLIPELCDVIPFDRRYWVKALLLPTVLNRICHAYCVEEFRRKIVRETGLGFTDLQESDWKPLEVDESYVDVEEEESVGIPFTNSLSLQNNLQVSLPLSQLKDKTQRNNKVVLDFERHMYEIGLCDLEFYVRKLKEIDQFEEEGGQIQEAEILAKNELLKLAALKGIETPTLKILGEVKDSSGPNLPLLIQACTAKSANDIVDYERLETLGDAFLKFAVTFFLFRNNSGNEGILTAVKGKIVGNRNLLYCGLEKGFQDVINVTDFVPLSDWNPPLFCLPERLIDEIISNNIDPAVLYRLQIPFDEQFSGVLSEATFQKNEEIIKSHDKCWEMPTNSLLPYKSIDDKTISDSVEAFIGAYLLTLGIPGALKFLLWLGILPYPKGSYNELISVPHKTNLLGPGGEPIVNNLLSEVIYSDLEDILDYRFKDKALLLEAITHPSYSRNRVTHCYQRLELLGDAVLDLVITTYVYENCGHLTPGQVTDIRSSLVNNITFACLVVRFEIYKYLLSFSSTLSKAIENFVSFQVSRNHVVDDNVLILFDENDCMIGESILVPKALGDLFESLAGAIYLDSGNSLETVWKVYYRLMKREIDEFTKTVPKTPVRLLHEICGDKPYYETRVISGLTKVSCTVYYENQEIKAHGFGPNKKEGKRSAAKLVLNKILALKK